jgi:Topoisomerase IA
MARGLWTRNCRRQAEENLPAVQQGERVETVRIEINTEQTRPPVRYNEGTILSAMEAAGKLVEDEELRDAMKEKGPRHARHARIHYRNTDFSSLSDPARKGTSAYRKGHSDDYLLKSAVPELTSPNLPVNGNFACAKSSIASSRATRSCATSAI